MKDREESVVTAKRKTSTRQTKAKKPAPIKTKPKKKTVKELTPKEIAEIAQREKDLDEKRAAENLAAGELLARARAQQAGEGHADEEEENPQGPDDEVVATDEVGEGGGFVRSFTVTTEPEDDAEEEEGEEGEVEGGEDFDSEIDYDAAIRAKLQEQGREFNSNFFGAQLWLMTQVAGIAPQVPDVMRATPPHEYRFKMGGRVELLMIWRGDDAKRMTSVFGPTSQAAADDVWSASFMFQGGAWVLRLVDVDDMIQATLTADHVHTPPAPAPPAASPVPGGQQVMYIPVVIPPYGYPLPGTAGPPGSAPPGTAGPPGRTVQTEQPRKMHELNPSGSGTRRNVPMPF